MEAERSHGCPRSQAGQLSLPPSAASGTLVPPPRATHPAGLVDLGSSSLDPTWRPLLGTAPPWAGLKMTWSTLDRGTVPVEDLVGITVPHPLPASAEQVFSYKGPSRYSLLPTQPPGCKFLDGDPSQRGQVPTAGLGGGGRNLVLGVHLSLISALTQEVQ
jgi:hypothetical protein